MHVNDFFDKVYCINLERREDRWQQCTKEFDRLGIEVERFEAIDGNTCGLDSAAPPLNWTKMKAGGVGCTLSHVKILKKAKANGYKNVLVLEDDIEFCENFLEEASDFLNTVPKDWDLIYMGGNHLQPPEQIGGIYKCKFTLTTHLIATNYTIYDLIIQEASKLNMIIDLVLATHQHKVNAYCSLKKLAWQVNGYSDIEDNVISYETVLKD